MAALDIQSISGGKMKDVATRASNAVDFVNGFAR
jgi:hypothetical protein